MEPLISVIVPIYKVEQYLDECVQSIIHQTYKNLEIVLVDDGSPDHCPQMCDEYANHDSRIKVIHKENGGLSSARNAGIDFSHGEWIYFIDSDDWIELNCIELLLKKAIETGVELVEGNGTDMFGYGLTKPIKDNKLLLKAFYSNKIHIEAWNRLIKSSVIKNNQLRFLEGLVYEDVPWGFSLASVANSIVSVEQKTYNYRYRSDSIMGKNNFERRTHSMQPIIFSIVTKAKQNGEINNPLFTSWLDYRMAVFFVYILESGYMKQAKSFYMQTIRKTSKFRGFTRTDLHLLFPPCIGFFVYRKFFGCHLC